MTTSSRNLGVYKKIHQVVSELRKEGISKNKEAKGNGVYYKFRGIDDVYNALSGVISEVGLIIIPKVVWSQSNLIPREGNRFSEHVIMHTEFTMIDPDDGSSIVGSAYGEAIDTSDKAFGKAQSYAYKAFAFQAFCIPTEGDNDTENNQHDIAPPVEASETISADQIQHIEDLLEETGANRAAFLQWVKAKQMSEIKRFRYDHIIKTLEKKRAEKATPVS